MRWDKAVRWVKHDVWRPIMILGAALVGYWILRGCFPSTLAARLPSSLESDLTARYMVCVTDTPIWPGEPRQPECGQVTFEVAGEGRLPEGATADGIDKAICFFLTTTNPTWTTQGTTRHEIIQHGRVLSKVALHQDGRWMVGPDEDQMDESQWNRYACPGAYRSQAFNP